jgi:hypothetical protein
MVYIYIRRTMIPFSRLSNKSYRGSILMQIPSNDKECFTCKWITYIVKTLKIYKRHKKRRAGKQGPKDMQDMAIRCNRGRKEGRDWLIIYSFTSRLRIFHLYGDVTIIGDGLQNLGLCSALRAFKQRGIFIVPHLLWHGTSGFPVSSEGPPHSVASYDTHEDAEDLF